MADKKTCLSLMDWLDERVGKVEELPARFKIHVETCRNCRNYLRISGFLPGFNASIGNEESLFPEFRRRLAEISLPEPSLTLFRKPSFRLAGALLSLFIIAGTLGFVLKASPMNTETAVNPTANNIIQSGVKTADYNFESSDMEYVYELSQDF